MRSSSMHPSLPRTTDIRGGPGTPSSRRRGRVRHVSAVLGGVDVAGAAAHRPDPDVLADALLVLLVDAHVVAVRDPGPAHPVLVAAEVEDEGGVAQEVLESEDVVVPNSAHLIGHSRDNWLRRTEHEPHLPVTEPTRPPLPP